MIFNKILPAVTLAASLLALPALAQNVVGSSQVDGQKVELLDDNTWRYAAEVAPGCDPIAMGVSFCYPAGQWQGSPPPGPDITAAYRHDDKHYAQFIIEAVGADDGANAGMMRKIVVQNAAAATGQSMSDIPTLAIEEAMIAGKNAETIVYKVNFDGLSVVFANSILIEKKQMMQAMTYALGTDFSAKHKALHAEFLEDIQMN